MSETIPCNYSDMDEAELRNVVRALKEMAKNAKTRAKKKLFDNRARAARRHLPPQECAAPDCTNMCAPGNEYCSGKCSGRAASYIKRRFDPEYAYRSSSYYRPEHKNAYEITGEIDALFEQPAWRDAIQQPFPGV